MSYKSVLFELKFRERILGLKYCKVKDSKRKKELENMLISLEYAIKLVEKKISTRELQKVKYL